MTTQARAILYVGVTPKGYVIGPAIRLDDAKLYMSNTFLKEAQLEEFNNINYS
jgi:hypothetical protein